jgi:phage-related holin
MDTSKTGSTKGKLYYDEKHIITVLIFLFSVNEITGILWAIKASDLEQAKSFLRSGRIQHFGIITGITVGKPHFIHR